MRRRQINPGRRKQRPQRTNRSEFTLAKTRFGPVRFVSLDFCATYSAKMLIHFHLNRLKSEIIVSLNFADNSAWSFPGARRFHRFSPSFHSHSTNFPSRPIPHPLVIYVQPPITNQFCYLWVVPAGTPSRCRSNTAFENFRQSTSSNNGRLKKFIP